MNSSSLCLGNWGWNRDSNSSLLCPITPNASWRISPNVSSSAMTPSAGMSVLILKYLPLSTHSSWSHMQNRAAVDCSVLSFLWKLGGLSLRWQVAACFAQQGVGREAKVLWVERLRIELRRTGGCSRRARAAVHEPGLWNLCAQSWKSQTLIKVRNIVQAYRVPFFSGGNRSHAMKEIQDYLKASQYTAIKLHREWSL